MSLWTVGLSLGWPLSAVYEYSYRSAVMSLLVLATLALALFIRRAFSWVSWVRMLRTFFVSFPLFTITNLAMVLWDRNLPHPLGNVLLAVPFFFALLISMWMSFPAHASSNAPKRREA
jgi:hypothetical protein